eukprot:COSAG02_NODE_10651_length_1891_cov_1.503348_2_plen_134_part_00
MLTCCFDSRMHSLGVDSFYKKWRLQVLLIPAAMMVMPLAMYYRHYRKDRDRALARLTGHSFAVVFFCCMCTELHLDPCSILTSDHAFGDQKPQPNRNLIRDSACRSTDMLLLLCSFSVPHSARGSLCIRTAGG